MPTLPPLLWLSADDVVQATPPIDERLRLAEKTMTVLATPDAAELPSKIGVHPRPESSFAHAMPAHLRALAPESDLVGIKWVAGFPSNTGTGIQAISAVIVVNDPRTGVPIALLDGAPVTAFRTAAVTGVVLRQLAGNQQIGGGHEVAIIGAGVQCLAHLPVVARVLQGSRIRIADRHPERAESAADLARRTPGIAEAVVAPSPRDAVAGADVVLTVASFAPVDARQAMTNDWLEPDATVVAVDYETFCSAEVARDAKLFLVDHREQFLASRDAGSFDDFPDPDGTIGEALLRGTPRPDGRVVVAHLGVGLADLVFADAIVRAATAQGLGTTLPR